MTNEIGNIETPEARGLLEQFKNRRTMTTVEVAEIIEKLCTILSKNCDVGRPKKQGISYGHLGDLLKIGKGGVSQYMSVISMPKASRDYLRRKDLPLIKAYYVSRVKGRDEDETMRMQINEINRISANGGGNRNSDTLIHKTLAANSVLKSVSVSHNIPEALFSPLSENNALASAKTTRENIQKCMSALSPRIYNLPILKQQLALLESMKSHNTEKCVCGNHISPEVLSKQLSILRKEVYNCEVEYRQPFISSLQLADNDLKAVIEQVERG